MVLMRSYLFCGSVRLGVIIISAFALAKSIIIVYVLTVYGIGFLLTVISTFDINMCYRNSYYLVRDSIFWLEKYPKTVLIISQLFSVTHISSCVLAAYGAYKLKKNFVMPLAFFEFLYIAEIITIFILFLRILRHFLSLGTLILLTIAATAYAILVVYDFFALVAFEQIVRLVRSKRYQQAYGPDPFNPVLNAVQGDVILTNTNDFSKNWIDSEVPITDRKLWWQVDNLKESAVKKDNFVINSHSFFQSKELLPEVLLRNAIILKYEKKGRTKF